ncbi:hypothetical protein GGQ97_001110 [Sphingomonas kaistensis]|uniref:Uncharacterized protein n=1 Tax=Sphingomonas kaistensis TaxID=298708 RepID=A0A7X6BGR0_9SPHN|nr:hypothetical protein [Sphingomonas kaistensis]NJC05317.1 hypothetical protein [Sphingomonas kaistensis]
MVSLKVASERASLEQVENRIVVAQRDIRVLQTEIGTRGRLEQLESWNVKVLALSAPQAHQFLEGEFQLATLAAPTRKVDPAAPVVLASAPAPEPRQVGSAQRGESSDGENGGPTARDLMQIASYKREIPSAPEKTVDKAPVAKPQAVKIAAVPAKAPAKPATVTKAKADSAAKAPAKLAATAGAKVEPKAKPLATIAKPKDVKARQ